MTVDEVEKTMTPVETALSLVSSPASQNAVGPSERMSLGAKRGMIEKPHLCCNQTGDVAQSPPIVCGEESRALYAADRGGICGGYQGES